MVIDESLWTSGQPKGFDPARIYFSQRKLQTAIEISGARRGARILEIGCFSGTLTFPLQRLGFEVTGFDVDEERLEFARKYASDQQLQHIAFEHGDAHDLSRFPDDSFDHVFSFQCFRYFSDLDRALREVRRVLKPGGTTAIDYPNRLSPFYAIYKRWVKGHDYEFPDYNYMSASEAVERHRSIGFRSVTTKTFLFAPPYVPGPALPLMKVVDRMLEPLPGINDLAGIVMVRAEK